MGSGWSEEGVHEFEEGRGKPIVQFSSAAFKSGTKLPSLMKRRRGGSKPGRVGKSSEERERGLAGGA